MMLIELLLIPAYISDLMHFVIICRSLYMAQLENAFADQGKILRLAGPSERFIYAIAEAIKTYGPAPLAVQLNGSGSVTTRGTKIVKHEWDLNGDGRFDDSSLADPVITFRYVYWS